MTELPDKKQVKEEKGLFGLCVQRDIVHHGRKDMASGREGMVAGVGAGWSHHNHTQEVENERKSGHAVHPKACTSDPLPSTRLYLLKVPQLPRKVPPVGDHVFTHSLWGSFDTQQVL